MKTNYLVSAIVSVYNSERFIAGCLEDLESQTIADKVEIIIINSGSQQNERIIIQKYANEYKNIVYIDTPERETIYSAWNRGIKASSGKYITNANSDDRHRRDAFEAMSNFLEKNSSVDLIYGDSIITETENETFDNCTPTGYINYSKDILDRRTYLLYGGVGNQPMWRKKIHDEFGYFDESLEVAGDLEFWIRISRKCKFKHINEYLGLYLNSPTGMEKINFEVTALETLAVTNSYLPEIKSDKDLYSKLKAILSKKYNDLALFYLNNRRDTEAIKTVVKSIGYDWQNVQAYKILIALIIPNGVRESIRSSGRFGKSENK